MYFTTFAIQPLLLLCYNSNMSTIPKSFSLPFIKKEQVAKDTYSFFFDRTKEEYNFLPGQYNKMTLLHSNADERGISRFFSVASSPLNSKKIMIITKIIQSSFKKSLTALTPGTKVEFYGPLGAFILHEEDKTPRVFLAGGIGITPFLSMITYVSEKNLSIPLTLFVSFSTVEEVIYFDKLNTIAKNNPSIKIIYTITNPENSMWQGEVGRISEELIKKYVQNVGPSQCFIAGPPKMVEVMDKIVKGMSVPQQQIHKENFTGY